jgi:peptidoglycan/xylan/chitin deacetylase (PgdA/CDA1 family)
MDRLSTVAERSALATESELPAARTAVVHVDLDGAAHIFRLHGWKWRGEQDPAYTTGVRHALDVFDDFGVRATFFVIAEDLDDPRKAEMLREIVRRGHEIASHSLTHSLLAQLDTAGKQREIAESRARLEERLGVTVAGFRAPFFSIDAESLAIAAECGYAWDSSIRAGREIAGLPGSRTATAEPWVLEAHELYELPLPGHRPLPFPFHPSYSLILGYRYFTSGLARHERTGAPLVLLFHLIDFADPLPRALLRGPRQRIFTLSHTTGERKRAACRRMLSRVRQAYEFADSPGLLAGARRQRAGDVR